MRRRSLQYLALLIYTLGAGAVLAAADLDSLSSLFLLTLFPLVYFWRRLHMHARLVFVVAVTMIAVTAAFEIFAHGYGVWYTNSVWPIRLFSSVPIEAFFAGFLQVLYVIVLYEFFCDDRKSAARLPGRAWGILLSIVLIDAVVTTFYLLPEIFISYAFLITLLTSGALLAFLIGIRHRDQLGKQLAKFSIFLLLWLPIAAVYELVALVNNARVYGNPAEYIGYFTVGGNILPYEAFLLAVLFPVWVVTLYELHVDD